MHIASAKTRKVLSHQLKKYPWSQFIPIISLWIFTIFGQKMLIFGPRAHPQVPYPILLQYMFYSLYLICVEFSINIFMSLLLVFSNINCISLLWNWISILEDCIVMFAQSLNLSINAIYVCSFQYRSKILLKTGNCYFFLDCICPVVILFWIDFLYFLILSYICFM